MDNWDLLGIYNEIIDLTGCVIPNGEKEKDIYIGLNARKYLIKSYEHCNKFHKNQLLKKVGGLFTCSIFLYC